MTPAAGADGSIAYLQQEYNDNVTINDTIAITAHSLTGVTLEYNDHQEAPQGSVIARIEDFIFVGGNQQYPTRFYRNTVAGSYEYWNHSNAYRDLDNDSGDPIVGAVESRNRVFVSIRDAAATVWLTGNSNDPVGHDLLPIGHGAVGPHAIVKSHAGIIYYLSELDIYASDGESEVNISSPPDPAQPSIRTFLADGWDRTRNWFISAAENRRKSQILFQLTVTGGTRNNLCIVYDTVGRKFWKHDWAFDFIAEVEAADDAPTLYGGIEGFICKIDLAPDDAAMQGDGVAPVSAIANGSGSGTTINVVGTPFVANTFKGFRCWVVGISGNGAVQSVASAIIYSNTTGAITLYTSVGFTDGAYLVIGGYQVYADLFVDFVNPQQLKRLFFITIAGNYITGAFCKIRLTAYLDSMIRVLTDPEYQATAQEFIDDWLSTDRIKIMLCGGFFRYMRLRISEMLYASGGTSLPAATFVATPVLNSHFALSEIQIECDEVDARG
jgi:hypothetical protein